MSEQREARLSTGPCGETAAVLVLSAEQLTELGADLSGEYLRFGVEDGRLRFD